MPVDPQIQMLLDRGSGVPATHTLPVAEARRLYEARIAVMAPPAAVAEVAERRIDGPDGPLALRLYAPHGKGPFPLLVFFHGSGFVLCSLDTHDGMCRNLAAGIGCIVASVDYRLAPEHKFPAGPNDCLAATRWLATHAVELGADPSRIMVAGDSAGGNMAAACAIAARDAGLKLAGQLLAYPVTDVTGRYSDTTENARYPSRQENASGYFLSRAVMAWFAQHYIGEAQGDDWRVSPLRAKNLADVAPAIVCTAFFDPLRDEGQAYVDALEAAGVATKRHHGLGLIHGYFGMGEASALAKAEAQRAWADFKTLLDGGA